MLRLASTSRSNPATTAAMSLRNLSSGTTFSAKSLAASSCVSLPLCDLSWMRVLASRAFSPSEFSASVNCGTRSE